MRYMLEICTELDFTNPLSITQEEAFYGACSRYEAETAFFNEKHNFYSETLPSPELTKKLAPYHALLKNIFPDHEIFRSQVVCNFPGEVVRPHIDPRLYHRLSHRVHLVLKTNPASAHVHFDQHQNIILAHLKEGWLYDFDNITPHSAFNLGETNRLHIITDVIPNAALRLHRQLFDTNPNFIPAGVYDEYYAELEKILRRYSGHEGLIQEYLGRVNRT